MQIFAKLWHCAALLNFTNSKSIPESSPYLTPTFITACHVATSASHINIENIKFKGPIVEYTVYSNLRHTADRIDVWVKEFY